jgi:hypothetical protein
MIKLSLTFNPGKKEYAYWSRANAQLHFAFDRFDASGLRK